MDNVYGAPASGTGSREPDPQAVPALTGFDPSRGSDLFRMWAFGSGGVIVANTLFWLASGHWSGCSDYIFGMGAFALVCWSCARDRDGSPKGGNGAAGAVRSTTAQAEGIAITPVEATPHAD